MAIVVGQIEPLKKLRKTLHANGITRFNSIAEINSFRNNFESEKKEVHKRVERSLDKEIDQLRAELAERQHRHDDLRLEATNEITHEVKRLEIATEQAIEKSNRNLFNKILYFLTTKNLTRKRASLEANLEKLVRKKTRITGRSVTKTKNKLDDYLLNMQSYITERCDKFDSHLNSTKKVVDGLYSLIAGAIGESSVVKEIQKLPDNYYLINDFSLNFDPPIYNKKENDRIRSIQIDHLLVCQAGVFLLETKNWTKQSIKDFDLRSPVEQVLRTSYAMFVLLNSESKFADMFLDRHHWGSKKIPVRNIIVMTNERPKEEFNHVKILSLKELNGYLQYFKQVFSDAEVKRLFDCLSNEAHRNP